MRVRALIAGVCASLAAMFAANAAAQQPAPSAASAQICATCHQEYVNTFEKGPHAARGAKGTPAALNAECAACHGDVSAHLKDPTKA